jgi:hypothetical protein
MLDVKMAEKSAPLVVPKESGVEWQILTSIVKSF